MEGDSSDMYKFSMKFDNDVKASTSQAWITFFKSMFGAGILALPNVLNEVGIPLGIIIFSLISVICSYSCNLLVESKRIAIISQQRGENQTLYDTDTTDSLLPNEGDDEPISSGSPCRVFGDSHTDRSKKIITYGDVARTLIDERAEKTIQFSIIFMHILFATGLLICTQDVLENLLEYDGEYYRYIIGLVIFPIVSGLSQISWLQNMWQLSALALVTYIVGVIGCSLFSALSQHGTDRPAPDDMWDFHWSGVWGFTGTSVYALEGIGLVLPTMHSMSEPKNASPVVCSGIILYAFLTISYATLVYAGGGGGLEKDDECDIVVNCIDPHGLRTAVSIALVSGLLMTHPVFLYPATQMLEVELSGQSCDDQCHDHNNTISNTTLEPLIVVNQHSASAEVISNDNNNLECLPEDSVSVNSLRIVKKNRLLRVSLCFATVLIGTIVHSFDSFSALVGSVFLSLAGFILPSILYYKALEIEYEESIPIFITAKLFLLFTFGIVLMLFGGTTAFIDLVGG